MRAFSALILASSILLAPAARATGPAVVSVISTQQAYRTAASFDRISEYFTGRENPGGQTILRSAKDHREGYYFLVRIDNRTSPVAGATFVLDVILPGDTEPKQFVFSAELPAGAKTFNIGVTGADWPAAGANPTAWALTVRGPGNAELAHIHSFLWAREGADAAK